MSKLKSKTKVINSGGQVINDDKDGKDIAKSTDHVYYNILLSNDTDTVQNMDFYENRTFPLLDKPSDYYMSITRFSIPGLMLPYFTYENSSMSVTLRYAGTDYQTNLIYQASSTAATPQYVTSYQQFLNMVNTALATSYAAIGALPTGTVAPYLIFDQASQIFYLIQQIANVTDGVTIYFSQKLVNIFPQFQYTYTDPLGSGTNGKFALVVVSNTFNNTCLSNGVISAAGTFYRMSQPGNVFYSWTSWDQLVIVGSVGTPPEYYNSLSGDGANKFKMQITDFEPALESAADARTTFVYFPQGPYRLIDIKQDDPMRSFRLQVFYTDKLTGEQTPLTLFPGTTATFKIMFRRKQLGL